MECQSNGVSRKQMLHSVLPFAEGRSCAVLLGIQASSSRAVKLHFLATGHILIFLVLLPSPLSQPLGMIISPLLQHTIIFQVCSYPSLLSSFMACFCPYAVLQICTVSVQYVKKVNVCGVQNVISIYLFPVLVIYLFFP